MQALQGTLDGRLFEVRVDRPRAAREVALDAQGVRFAAVFGDRLHLEVDSGADRLAGIERRLADAGFRVTYTGPLDPSLEDVFISRIGERERATADA